MALHSLFAVGKLKKKNLLCRFHAHLLLHCIAVTAPLLTMSTTRPSTPLPWQVRELQLLIDRYRCYLFNEVEIDFGPLEEYNRKQSVIEFKRVCRMNLEESDYRDVEQYVPRTRSSVKCLSFAVIYERRYDLVLFSTCFAVCKHEAGKSIYTYIKKFTAIDPPNSLVCQRGQFKQLFKQIGIRDPELPLGLADSRERLLAQKAIKNIFEEYEISYSDEMSIFLGAKSLFEKESSIVTIHSRKIYTFGSIFGNLSKVKELQEKIPFDRIRIFYFILFYFILFGWLTNLVIFVILVVY